MIRVRKRQLGSLTELGEGGMAKVYRVGGRVSNLPKDLAYKEILPDLDSSHRQQMLDAMRNAVALRDTMSSADLAELDALTTWPLGMVEEGGVDVGTVMCLIGDDFFLPTKPTGGTLGRRVFEFQLLGVAPTQVRQLGIDRSEADDDLVRLALMARLAYVIEVIHKPRRQGRLVYGDLNLRNTAVATNPPRILLMDCDGVADEDDLSRVQPNTLFFIPPEIRNGQQKHQDQTTDVYKLGLCVIRGLAIGKGATQLHDPASRIMIPGLLDQDGIDLINRAVGADRANRPTAEEIKDYLIGRVLSLAQPPELCSAALGRVVTIRGSDTLVRWTQQHGTTVRIRGVNGFELTGIDADAHPNGYPIRPPTAGPIFVEVSNKHGSDELLAGYLDYFEPPTFDFEAQLRGLLPRPAMPDLPGVEVPAAAAKLPPYPVVSTNTHPVPRVEFPSIDPHITATQFTADTLLGEADPRAAIIRAHQQASERIATAVGSGTRRMLAAIHKKIGSRTAAVADGFDAQPAPVSDLDTYPEGR